MSQATVVELANAIAKDTSTVNDYLERHNLPQPTFDQNGPKQLRIPPSEPDAFAAHARAVSATRELNILLQGPAAHLQRLHPVNDLLSLQFINRFNVAAHVPADGEISYHDLAKAVGVDQQLLTRMLRYSATDYIFRETQAGLVQHTAASRAIHDSDATRALLGLSLEEGSRGASRTVDAIEKYGASDDPIESGWGLANSATQPMYTELALRHPARAATVAAAMDALAATVSLTPLLDTYDFSAGKASATVVDVGGGSAALGAALVQHFPTIHCIVQDLPDVVGAGEARRAALPDAQRARLTLQAHDCFEAQPVRDADVFVLRAVLHNWSDGRAARILGALVPALRRGVRVVVLEAVLGAPGSMPAAVERIRRAVDLNMLTFFNARERDEADWAALFRRVDGRFRVLPVRRVGRGPAAFMAAAVVEAVWEP